MFSAQEQRHWPQQLRILGLGLGKAPGKEHCFEAIEAVDWARKEDISQLMCFGFH